MVWFRWGCTASCGWNVRCVGVRGGAWPVFLSPCNTDSHATTATSSLARRSMRHLRMHLLSRTRRPRMHVHVSKRPNSLVILSYLTLHLSSCKTFALTFPSECLNLKRHQLAFAAQHDVLVFGCQLSLPMPLVHPFERTVVPTE